MATAIHNRRCSGTDNHRQNENAKDKIFYQIVLESTDDESNDSIESICSVQAETTVSAKDSSDISTHDESESYSEFELASSPAETWRHPWCFDQNISSDGSPRKLNIIETEPVQIESDHYQTSLEDNSQTDSDTPTKIHHKFLYCTMCSSLNRNPFFPLCNSCYKIKKGFFPEKPTATKKRKRKNEKDYVNLQKKLKYIESKSKSSIENSPTHASNSNNQSDTSGSNISRLTPENTGHSTETIIDSGFESSQTYNSQEWTNDSNQNGDEKCMACLLNDTNALFLHGKTGHRCFCYRCAKKIWFESQRCPICRCKVNNVIYILNT